MGKQRKSGRRPAKPDDYFAAGPFEFARFGKTTIGRSRATAEQFAAAQAKMVELYLTIVGEIDAVVNAIASRIARLPPEQLLYRAWWEFASSMIGLKGKLAESDQLSAMRMVDYVQSVIASIPAQPYAPTVTEEEWESDHVQLTLMPVTQAVGFPPTDAMVMVMAEDPPIPMLNQRLGFEFPRIGQTVFNIGFASSGATSVGITRGDMESGKFDWDAAFQATLSVAEGRVTRLFPSGHSSFLKAPCFEFDGPMAPGMSGGPIMTEDGLIIGINSADASLFQGPGEMGTSLGSPLSPLLFGTTKIPLIRGPLTISFELGIFDLIGHGAIATDGSEETVWFDRDSYGQLLLCSRVDRDDLSASYESLAQALENLPVQEGSGVASGFTLKRVRT